MITSEMGNVRAAKNSVKSVRYICLMKETIVVWEQMQVHTLAHRL